MTTPAAPYMKRSHFAAHIGKTPGYITQQAAQGRIVFTPDGRFVDVAATTALLAATASPDKQHVADRHAAARAQAVEPDWADSATDKPTAAERQRETHARHAEYRAQYQLETAAAGKGYQNARAVKERFLALEAKRAYEVAMGQLRDAREVEHAVATAFTATRTALRNLAQTLAPVLAATTTEEAARTEMATAFEAILAELSTTLAAMATHTK